MVQITTETALHYRKSSSQLQRETIKKCSLYEKVAKLRGQGKINMAQFEVVNIV